MPEKLTYEAEGQRPEHPVRIAAEVIAVMGGYPCTGEPSWNGSPCAGPPCVQHCYRPLSLPGSPSEIAGAHGQLSPEQLQAIGTWLRTAHWIREQNHSRLFMLLSAAVGLRDHLRAHPEPEGDAMSHELRAFTAKEWEVVEIPASIGEARRTTTQACGRAWQRAIPERWQKWLKA